MGCVVRWLRTYSLFTRSLSLRRTVGKRWKTPPRLLLARFGDYRTENPAPSALFRWGPESSRYGACGEGEEKAGDVPKTRCSAAGQPDFLGVRLHRAHDGGNVVVQLHIQFLHSKGDVLPAHTARESLVLHLLPHAA